MIKAASLFYALTVSLLLACVLSGVITTAHLRAMRAETWIATNACRDNALAGILRPITASGGLVGIRDSSDLFHGQDDPVVVKCQPWGLYDLRDCTAYRADRSAHRSALTGGAPPRSVLYVADHGEPIALAGTIQLNAPCSFPAAGTRRAYIEGRPLQGDLPTGNIGTSDRTLAPLRDRLHERLARYCDPEGPAFGDIPHAVLPPQVRTLTRSVAEGPLVLDVGRQHVLPAIDISGPFVLLAHDSLVLPAGMHCSGIIVCAPYITIAQGFTGDLQCFTYTGAHIEDDVELAYPSVLACMARAGAPPVSIALGEHVRLDGAIIGHDPDAGRVSVELGEADVVRGEVWCDGPAQLHGRCEGVVMVEELVLRTPSSVYRGHLMDLVMDTLAHHAFIGCGLGKDDEPGVLRWFDDPL